MFSANSSQVSEDRLYVEDVFSTYLYTGNGSLRNITNGIDLATKGGMVWIKSRSSGSLAHVLYDTARGPSYQLVSNASSAEYYDSTGLNNFNSDGFQIWNLANVNSSGGSYTSWTFRKAPKFFDVVTYTGDGASSKTISHNLGSAPGFVIVKRTDSTSDWFCWHRELETPIGVNYNIFLNTTGARNGNGAVHGIGNPVPTSTQFTVRALGNESGATYVAYLFAHDTTSDGIIQCGSFTANSGADVSVNLGWEPQWVMIKASSTTGSWLMYDNMRGFVTDTSMASSSSAQLLANTTGAEGTTLSRGVNQTGFSTAFGGTATYIYIAIRRGPMRTPTSGTSVFSPVIWTGNATSPRTITGGGFPVDLSITYNRGTAGWDHLFVDRLRGAPKNTSTSYLLQANSTVQEITNQYGAVGALDIQDGVGLYTGSSTFDNTNASGNTYVGHFFRRAPSFFDEVCYTGDDVSGRTISHNLKAIPELMIVKRRSASSNWIVYSASIAANRFLQFDLPDPSYFTGNGYWNNTRPTSSVFTLGNDGWVNGGGSTFVAYLFSSCPGVSKVGSYTGNGSSQTINCGFAAGARFVMIKRTDSTGDWYVWDTARGIFAGNDPRLSLNSTAAEVTTDDSVDTDSSGFVVNQLSATNINVSSATYIYLAVA